MERIHEKKMKQMEESFAYFNRMRQEMLVDSQIKIAACFRKRLRVKQ